MPEFMRLFHISRDIDKDIQEFVPQIPEHTFQGEDKKIPRVCTSPDLSGCMAGHPNLFYYESEYMQTRYADPYQMMDMMNTLLDHNEKTGQLFKVYVLDVEIDKIYKPTKIEVPDVDITNEYWIMESITPTEHFYVMMESAEKEDDKYTFNYSKYEPYELGRVADGFYHWDKDRKTAV